MKKHLLLLLLCCAMPLVLIVALSAAGILGSWGFYALILLCPMMHLLMMRRMHDHEDSNHEPASQIPTASERKHQV